LHQNPILRAPGFRQLRPGYAGRAGCRDRTIDPCHCELSPLDSECFACRRKALPSLARTARDGRLRPGGEGPIPRIPKLSDYGSASAALAIALAGAQPMKAGADARCAAGACPALGSQSQELRYRSPDSRIGQAREGLRQRGASGGPGRRHRAKPLSPLDDFDLPGSSPVNQGRGLVRPRSAAPSGIVGEAGRPTCT